MRLVGAQQACQTKRLPVLLRRRELRRIGCPLGISAQELPDQSAKMVERELIAPYESTSFWSSVITLNAE